MLILYTFSEIMFYSRKTKIGAKLSLPISCNLQVTEPQELKKRQPPAMKGPAPWTLCLLILLLGKSRGQQLEAGLFPPIEFSTSFSSFRSVSSTSTCSPCTDTGCTNCNSTCPYGQDSPEPVNMLEEGEPSFGVVRKLWLNYVHILGLWFPQYTSCVYTHKLYENSEKFIVSNSTYHPHDNYL